MNETEKQIIEILEKLRPYLQRDGGDVEYVKFEDGIEQILLEEVPGVIGVENVDEYLA